MWTNLKIYRVDKAVRTGLLVLVDLVDNQEHHANQKGQGADHQQGHLGYTQVLTLQFISRKLQ